MMQIKLEVVVSGENLKSIILEHIELLDDIAASVDQEVWTRWHRMRFPSSGNCCEDSNLLDNDHEHQQLQQHHRYTSYGLSNDMNNGSEANAAMPESSTDNAVSLWNRGPVETIKVELHDSYAENCENYINKIRQDNNADTSDACTNIKYELDVKEEEGTDNPWHEQETVPLCNAFPIMKQTLAGSGNLYLPLESQQNNANRGTKSTAMCSSFIAHDFNSSNLPRKKRKRASEHGANLNSGIVSCKSSTDVNYSQVHHLNSSIQKQPADSSQTNAASTATDIQQKQQGSHKSHLREILNQKSQFQNPSMASLIMKEILKNMRNKESLQTNSTHRPSTDANSNSVLRTLLNS